MFSETVMVSVGVSKLRCTELFFVQPGVKINCAYYCDLLTQTFLPVIKQISENEFVFQQDSSPACRARETIELLPNSSDLNPVDYKLWATMF